MARIVIIGAGHNGLVCAFYLAREGYKVLVLEQKSVVGGAAQKLTLRCGCQISVGATHFGMFAPRIIGDMGLANFALACVPAEPAMIVGVGQNQSIAFHADQNQFEAEIRRFSIRDGRRVRDFIRDVDRAAQLLAPLLFSRSATLAEYEAALRRENSSFPQLFLGGSVGDTVKAYFENDQVQGAILSTLILGNTNPFHEGTAVAIPYLALSNVHGRPGWGIPQGGMGGFCELLAAKAVAAGAEIVVDSEVSQIVIQAGSAKGVLLTDGTQINADFVVSNTDPYTTSTKLCGLAQDDETFSTLWKSSAFAGPACKLNLLLTRRPTPDRLRRDHDELLRRSLYVVCESLADACAAFETAESNGFSMKPYCELVLPSEFSPSLSCGKHITASVYLMFANGSVVKSQKPGIRRKRGTMMMKNACALLGIAEDSIAWQQFLDPLDLEAELGLCNGNVDHGSFLVGNLFERRGSCPASNIGALTICGSGTHPGGLVSGIPGYNAASRIIEQLSLRRSD